MSSDPNQPPIVPGPREPGQPAAAPVYRPPVAAQPAAAPVDQPPAPAQQQFTPPVYQPPVAERSLLEKRPEILIGAATVGGFVAAQILGRIRGR